MERGDRGQLVTNLSVELFSPTSTVELVGYAEGERVWRGVQSYRIVPGPTLFADGARLSMDFSSPNIAPLTTYTSGADVSQGWTVQNGHLKVGLGDHYPDNLHSEAALFLDLRGRSQPLTVSFDVEGATEQDYDYFSVSSISGSTRTEIVQAVSGPIAARHVSFDLTAFLGSQTEIRFTFTSDGGVTGRGVLISNLAVE